LSATQPRKVISNTDRPFQIVEHCDVWPASNTIVHQRLGMEYYNSGQIVKLL
ncbi:3524_t:CDS:1, partial [Paraglomus brasilianum]